MAKRDITNYSNIFTKKEQNLFSGIWIKVTSSYKTIGLNNSICLVLTKKNITLFTFKVSNAILHKSIMNSKWLMLFESCTFLYYSKNCIDSMLNNVYWERSF